MCSKSAGGVPVGSEFQSDFRQEGTRTCLGNSSINNRDRSHSEEFAGFADVAGEVTLIAIKCQGRILGRVFVLWRAHLSRFVSD